YTYPEQRIDELLELAGAENSPQSRCDLLNTLQLAQMTWEDENNTSTQQRPPPKKIEQFENSIKKVLTLLRSIRKYKDWRNVGFVTQPVGRGVVGFATTQEMILGRVLELPRHPLISDQELIFPTIDRISATMNIEPLLRACILFARRRRRGR